MNIIEFLQSNFNNTRVGSKNVQMPCPFHNDHLPGHFNMDFTTGLWHCYHASCLAGGNLRTFLRMIDKPDLYKKIETVEPTKKASEYIERKVTVLPESSIGLFSNYTSTELINAGFSRKLLKNKQIGFDKNQYRITFPIRNQFGELVGVSGRKAVDHIPGPRYKFYISEFEKVYPGYEFNKSKVLYNIDEAKAYLHFNDGPLIVVEGFKACLWMIQCGYPNTVALMGTTISNHQLKLISSLTNEIYLFLDNDEGGPANVIKTGDRLAKLGKVYVILGEKEQPDDYEKQEIIELITKKKPLNLIRLEEKNG